jgi:hypothetical protein
MENPYLNLHYFLAFKAGNIVDSKLFFQDPALPLLLNLDMDLGPACL